MDDQSGKRGKKISIFDWDDTFFPSYFVNHTDIDMKSSEHLIQMFKPLDLLITEIALTIVSNSDITYIVTNASMMWINRCLTVLPNFSSIIEMEIIEVISARDTYGKHGVNNWKVKAFEYIYKKEISNNKGCHHILSMGDSDYEHEALQKCDEYSNKEDDTECILKSLRFKKKPSLNQLVEQLRIVKNSYDEIMKRQNTYSIKLKNFLC